MASIDVFRDLIDDINRYGGRWTAYLAGLEGAYAAAYASQQEILGAAKASIEAQRKQEEENRIFALSMVTAGMGGLFATHFSKQWKNTAIQNFPDIAKAAGGDEIINEMVSKAGKAVSTGKDALKGASKDVTDWALKMTGIKNSDLSGEPFIPAAVSPAQYGANLRQGAQERVNALNDIAFFWRDNASMFPLEAAELMRAAMKQSAFFLKAPPSKMEGSVKSTLTSRAKLALWISWGLERDLDYWTVQSAMRLYGPSKSETYHWEPLRRELISLGVPEVIVSFREYYSPRKYTPGMMRMDEFVRWVSKPEALVLLFKDLPQDLEGMTWVKDRWSKKKVGLTWSERLARRG